MWFIVGQRLGLRDKSGIDSQRKRNPPRESFLYDYFFVTDGLLPVKGGVGYCRGTDGRDGHDERSFKRSSFSGAVSILFLQPISYCATKDGYYLQNQSPESKSLLKNFRRATADPLRLRSGQAFDSVRRKERA